MQIHQEYQSKLNGEWTVSDAVYSECTVSQPCYTMFHTLSAVF